LANLALLGQNRAKRLVKPKSAQERHLAFFGEWRRDMGNR
jgi:hypothetical protein